MEVCTGVEVEDACNGVKIRVCRAYFTYVVQSEQGGKQPLSPIYPNTPVELKEFLLASERRRSRLTRKVITFIFCVIWSNDKFEYIMNTTSRLYQFP